MGICVLFFGGRWGGDDDGLKVEGEDGSEFFEGLFVFGVALGSMRGGPVRFLAFHRAIKRRVAPTAAF